MKNRTKNTPSQVRRKHMGQVTKLQELKGKLDTEETIIKSCETAIEKCNATLAKLHSDLEKFKEENAEFEIPKTEATIQSVGEQLFKERTNKAFAEMTLNILKSQVTNCKLVITVPTAKFKKCFALKGINVPLM